jgi:hypothetical protein
MSRRQMSFQGKPIRRLPSLGASAAPDVEPVRPARELCVDGSRFRCRGRAERARKGADNELAAPMGRAPGAAIQTDRGTPLQQEMPGGSATARNPPGDRRGGRQRGWSWRTPFALAVVTFLAGHVGVTLAGAPFPSVDLEQRSIPAGTGHSRRGRCCAASPIPNDGALLRLDGCRARDVSDIAQHIGHGSGLTSCSVSQARRSALDCRADVAGAVP